MGKLGVLNGIICAGFRERSRRYSFIATLGFIILIAYKYIPPSDADYLTLSLGNIRGVYNSAWIGAALAIATSAILSLPAFYLVKNSIEGDIETGVGQIIAATPMTWFIYALGKMLSNFTVLAVMVLMIAISGLVMQFVRGEVFMVDIIAFVTPFAYSTLPTMAMVAALAILFECIPLLRGSFGNVVYFFLWIVCASLYAIAKAQAGFETGMDLLGIDLIISDVVLSASTVFPDYQGQLGIGVTPALDNIRTFAWYGVSWTFELFAGRMLWVAAAFSLASVSSLFFDRFDATRMVKSKKAPKGDSTMRPVGFRSRYARILSGELMLMLKGLSLWWYAVLMLINLFALTLPIGPVRQVVLPLALLWPLVAWSSLGVREKRGNTQGLVFTSPGLMKHQFSAMLLSGVITAMLSSWGVVIRFATQGLWVNIIALVTAALFISSLALLCGVLSGNSKVFEVVYMAMWYIGPINQFEPLDFIGTSGASMGNHTYVYCFIAAMLLSGLAFAGRIRQTRPA